MTFSTLAVATTIALALATRPLSAQSAPRTAIAAGYSPAAGLIGAEWVRWPRSGRLGMAVGAGLAGAGGRVNVSSVRRDNDRRRVPYVGAGYLVMPWLPFVSARGAASLEGGVQFWPAPGHRFYADLGAGAALLHGSAGHWVGPVLRLTLGRAL